MSAIQVSWYDDCHIKCFDKVISKKKFKKSKKGVDKSNKTSIINKCRWWERQSQPIKTDLKELLITKDFKKSRKKVLTKETK